MPILPADDALRFLARASHTLTASLDYETTLRTLARLCVPDLADWCGVDLVDGSGELRRLAVTHVDPEREHLGWELHRRYPPARDAERGSYAVLRTGRSDVMSDIPDELLAQGARDAEHLALLRELGLSSFLIAPIVSRDRIAGAFILATSGSARRLGPEDLPLAEEIGRRAGLAIDNALTHQAERQARARAEAAAERSARLLEITSALSSAPDPGAVATIVAERGLGIIGARAGGVMAVEGDELVVLATVGYDHTVVEPYRRLPLTAPVPVVDAVRTAQPIFLDTRADRSARYPALDEVSSRVGSGALAAIPLIAHGETLGAIALSFGSERPLSDEERAFVLTLAAQCAQALDRAKAYASERASQARLRRVVDSSMLGIAFWDGERVTDCNDALLAMLGYDREDLARGALRHGRLTPPEYAAADRRAIEECAARGTCTPYEKEFFRKDGSRVPVLVGGTVFETGGGLFFVLDRTDQLRAEEQVQAAQRMEAVGRLAGGVAHEINNALQGVLGFAAFVRKGLPADSPLLADVEQIRMAGNRAADIAQQLLAFGRRQVRRPVNLDLATVVSEFTPMLRQALGPERELAVDFAAGHVGVHADRGQLEQVLLNLALNARDAMPGGGRLTVCIGHLAVRPDTVVRTLVGTLPPGRYAMIEVQDTGVGIEPQLMASIFEPFFTTKGPGRGTGLGLAVVYGIVKQSNGYVAVHSTPGDGATFRIYLPEVAPGAPSGPEQQTRPPSGNELVLLVDDDPLILAVGSRILREGGYRVVEASDGATALERLAEASSDAASRVSLIVTDVLMPGVSGRELGGRIEQRYPSLPVVYISGHADDAALAVGSLPPHAAFLAKPFAPDELLSTVRRLLDRARAPTAPDPVPATS
jgi:PAS domain S-box-containing protein